MDRRSLLGGLLAGVAVELLVPERRFWSLGALPVRTHPIRAFYGQSAIRAFEEFLIAVGPTSILTQKSPRSLWYDVLGVNP